MKAYNLVLLSVLVVGSVACSPPPEPTPTRTAQRLSIATLPQPPVTVPNPSIDSTVMPLPPTEAPSPTEAPNPTRGATPTATPLVDAIGAETNVWRSIGPWPWTSIVALAIDPLTPTTLYAGTLGSGVFRSTNGGESWSLINTGLTSGHVFSLAIDQTTPTILYAGTYASGVLKSTDGGEDWSSASAGLAAASAYVLTVDRAMPSTLYAGTDSGVFKSTDGAGSWQSISSGLLADDVVALVVDPQDSAILYAGAGVDGVFKSIDGGTTWNAINAGLTDHDVRALAIDPLTTTTLYAATGSGGVFKSINGGWDWTAANTGLNATEVWTVVVDPVTPDVVYAVAPGSGVFRSSNGADSWIALNTGLPLDADGAVFALAADPVTPTTLYAGTRGVGVLIMRVDPDTASQQVPSPAAPPPARTPEPSPTGTVSEMPALSPLEAQFSVSGKLHYREQIQIPDDARVVAVWQVAAGSDHGYVFGEGTVDLENDSFRIQFDGPPPSEAVNWAGSSALGVGLLFITTDQTLGTGPLLPESFSATDIVGVSGQYSIIYVRGDFETLEEERWFHEFNQGYSAGRGIEILDSSFDGFEPIDPTTFEIFIGDLENVEFTNWS